MVKLIGTYECKVDAKGRLMVPAPLKKQLNPVLEEGFVLKRSVYEECLELYPMEAWNKKMEELEGLTTLMRDNADLIRVFTAGVKLVEVDANGRLLIPKDLLQYAQIDKDIVMTAALGIVEIWDKENYEKALNRVEDFGKLAKSIMGNINNNGVS